MRTKFFACATPTLGTMNSERVERILEILQNLRFRNGVDLGPIFHGAKPTDKPAVLDVEESLEEPKTDPILTPGSSGNENVE